MTGSYFRTPEIGKLFKDMTRAELGEEYNQIIRDGELRAIRDQLHPGGSAKGLSWISNGEQRKSGYANYLPNRFHGFSTTEKGGSLVSDAYQKDLDESNPVLAAMVSESSPFNLNKVEDRLEYTGEKLARNEALEFRELARQEGAKRLFLNAPSPGVLTILFNGKGVYRDHEEYLYSMAEQMAREYRAILSVEGVDLQIDAPDLGMGNIFNNPWGNNLVDLIPDHVNAINEALKGLPQERVRVHYCYGNYSGSHTTDPDFRKLLPEVARLRAGTLVGEMANARHAGDPLIIRDYVKEHGWPGNMDIAAGVIDVKSNFVETPEAVALKLESLTSIDDIGPERVIGGTDCGFQTFSWYGNITHSVGERKLKALVDGAGLLE